ncbi:hypothetical protein [Nonomuraea rubra]|uniref:hypothetical protein n=1 Tax=Nonomuraea rubra TaxID=46180 RepID=UPI0033C733FA
MSTPILKRHSWYGLTRPRSLDLAQAMRVRTRACCPYYTSAEQVKCARCRLDSVEERVGNWRRVLAEEAVPR